MQSLQPMFPMQPYNPPPPQERPVQAAAGMGEYGSPDAFEAAAGFGAAQGIAPFEAAAGMGMGSYHTYPVRRGSTALRTMAAFSPLAGALGQVADAVSEKKQAEQAGMISAGVATGVVVTAVLVGLVLRGGAGYIVGKAIAPSEKDETAYAWGGVLASIFLGSLGLGIEALVAGSRR